MQALNSIFAMNIIVPWILAMFLGIFVGGIPGLTATMAVALIVPLTYHMVPIAGLAMIIGVSFTSIFAGDIPATFLRIPGTPASGAAVLDGYELTKRGQGYLAITLDLVCSALGGVIGILILIFGSPVLAGREAVYSVVAGMLDGAPIKIAAVTVVKNYCTYDLTYSAPLETFDDGLPDFERTVDSFSVLERKR